MRKMKDSGIEWIGEIPEDWECFYLSQIFSQVKNKNIGIQETNLLSLSYGKIIRKNIETTFGLLPENFEGYNIIERDNIVLRLTDLQNDHKSLRVGLVTEKGIITSAYLTLKNKTNMSSNYFYYLLHSFDIAKGFYGMGAGVRQGLNWNEIRSLRIISPKNVPEQQRIADFLDDKVAQIDSVISKTRETIEEYKKLKQSIITEAVTGKVKIENGKVKGKYDTYKDSGIEWIGEIPSEWNVKRLKFSSKVRNEKYSESYGVLEYFGLENIESHSAKFIETENIYDITQSQICRKDDIVFGKLRPYLAKIFEVPIDECCSSEFAVFYNFEGYNKFFKYLFLSYWFITIVDASTYGTKMPRANIDFIKNMIIPLPDFESQYKISDFLDKKCSEIDKLITKKEQLVVELEAYKKSLIYEVVTGKKEIC